jgi:hypothetical protein
MTTTVPRMKPIRTKRSAAAAASASVAPARASSTAPRSALHRHLSRYLIARRTAEHVSAVSLRVTFPRVCVRLEQRRAELTAHTPQNCLPRPMRLGPDCPVWLAGTSHRRAP